MGMVSSKGGWYTDNRYLSANKNNNIQRRDAMHARAPAAAAQGSRVGKTAAPAHCALVYVRMCVQNELQPCKRAAGRRAQRRPPSSAAACPSGSRRALAPGAAGGALGRFSPLAVGRHCRLGILWQALHHNGGVGQHGVAVLQLPHLHGSALGSHLLLRQPLVSHQHIKGRHLRVWGRAERRAGGGKAQASKQEGASYLTILKAR